MEAKVNFSSFKKGTKVESRDKDGYFIMNACGYVAETFESGDAIIKTFGGSYFSTVSQTNIFEVEAIY